MSLRLFWGTHNEIDVEEKANVEEEVGWTGNDESPSVDGFRQLYVILEERYDGMPNAHSAQNTHRRQYVFILNDTKQTEDTQ